MFQYAYTYGTCNVPPLQRKFLPELFKLWLTMTRKLKMRLPLAIIINGLTASTLAYFEASSFYNVKQKIHEKDLQFAKQIYEKK